MVCEYQVSTVHVLQSLKLGGVCVRERLGVGLSGGVELLHKREQIFIYFEDGNLGLVPFEPLARDKTIQVRFLCILR